MQVLDLKVSQSDCSREAVYLIAGTVTIQPGVELDYESDTRVYTVQVVATSSDRRTAVTTIRVEISDINDNPPQFEVVSNKRSLENVVMYTNDSIHSNYIFL